MIVRIGPGDTPDLANLAVLAEAEGYRFVTRAQDEWLDGSNRFDLPGEGLFVALVGSETVGVAGLNRDPFLNDPTVGRLRRVYVAPHFRGRGIGSELVVACLGLAADEFSQVRLKTDNPAAAHLYEGLGFEVVDEESATHSLIMAE